ncbi:hypothetical protein EAF04_005941 [Stromatinia cepivora]|nr:hypothetical protein EAF04_005941 [Stromatinia cepivora]
MNVSGNNFLPSVWCMCVLAYCTTTKHPDRSPDRTLMQKSKTFLPKIRNRKSELNFSPSVCASLLLAPRNIPGVRVTDYVMVG